MPENETAAPTQELATVAKLDMESREQAWTEFWDAVLALNEQQQLATAIGMTFDPNAPQSAAALAKIDNVAGVLSMAEAEISYFEAQRRAVDAQIQKRKRACSAIMDALQLQMESWGVNKIGGRAHSFLLKKNPPSVEIVDDSLIPDEYRRWPDTIPPNKTAIKEALQAGKEVPGAKLAAESKHLEVK